MEGYPKHRTSILETVRELYEAYGTDLARALSCNGEPIEMAGRALEEHGAVRLYKYQPFSERNLKDCVSGVLHMTPLTELNDINEGAHRFDVEKAVSYLSNADPGQVQDIDFGGMPPFIKAFAANADLSVIEESLGWMKESGELREVVAPSFAVVLESCFRSMRQFQLCASLSETECSASMWDRYANSHRGFATGYSVSSFVAGLSCSRDNACDCGQKALIAPVYYGQRIEMTALAAASMIQDPSGVCLTNVSTLMLMMSLLQKAREWEHELEWRAISYACPHAKGVHYCGVIPDSIYLGIDMQEDERNRAIEVARQNRWDVFQMKQSFDSPDWTLESEQVM